MEIELVAENKHIAICKTDLMPQRKTTVFAIINKKEAEADRDMGLLGVIQWNAPWRQYCFYPEPNCIWSTSCLDTVQDFTKKLNGTKEYKEHPRDNSGGETAKVYAEADRLEKLKNNQNPQYP